MPPFPFRTIRLHVCLTLLFSFFFVLQDASVGRGSVVKLKSIGPSARGAESGRRGGGLATPELGRRGVICKFVTVKL